MSRYVACSDTHEQTCSNKCGSKCTCTCQCMCGSTCNWCAEIEIEIEIEAARAFTARTPDLYGSDVVVNFASLLPSVTREDGAALADFDLDAEPECEVADCDLPAAWVCRMTCCGHMGTFCAECAELGQEAQGRWAGPCRGCRMWHAPLGDAMRWRRL